MAEIDVATLRRVIRQCHETGKLFWLERTADLCTDGGNGADANASTWNLQFAGKEALATPHVAGYLEGRILGRSYLAHRVIWALHHGEWPAGEVDHINGDRRDNRLTNLRAVSRAANARNMRRSKANTSGATGVTWHKAAGKWHAQIVVSGRNKSLGLYHDIQDAIAARKAAEARYGYHENHGRAA